MTVRAPQVHYLRGNKGERTPHRFLVLDLEAQTEGGERRELQTPRLWRARLVRRHDREPKKPRRADFGGNQLEGLPETVLSCCSSKETLWLFAHNLSYDLGLSKLPIHLLRAGFVIGRHNLASEAPWAYLKKGSRALRLADSWSWLPVSVERLGEVLKTPKPELPATDAGAEAWGLRCQADVAIVAEALEQVMDEWDRRQLGWWSLTGPASGWNSMLHMHAGQRGRPWRNLERREDGEAAAPRSGRTVIDPDPAARAFERLALYSGRRDLWRSGHLVRGPWLELDLKTAHLAICAARNLPFRRWRAFDRLELGDWRVGGSQASIIARVRVRPAVPRYPLRLPGVIVHPVGEFETILAGPEIADAQARGELAAIGPGYGYHLGPHMREWAEWALAVLNSSPEEINPLLQVMVKGWSRTVPGRWGMTVAREVARGSSHVADWSLEPALVGTPPRRGFIFHLAGAWSESVRDQEAEDSFPAVLAHIQAWTRLGLGRLIDCLPEGCLASCNTEGLWVHQAALDGLESLAAGGQVAALGPRGKPPSALDLLNSRTTPLEVRIKQTAKALRVLSPQHLEIDHRRAFSGVPRSAAQIGPDRYEFWTWPKLAGQIERGDPRGYVRELRRVDLAGLPVSRWSYVDGCCEPVEAAWSPETGNSILSPRAVCSCHGARLGARQHPALRMALRGS